MNAEIKSSRERIRSVSAGRDKKSELHARYWAFLFDNLERAVDEIFQTCESDESIQECEEVILVLDNFTRDFHNLIKWLNLNKEYENTSPPHRPGSLTWEVRRSSPGKIPVKRIMQPRLLHSMAKKRLDLESGRTPAVNKSLESIIKLQQQRFVDGGRYLDNVSSEVIIEHVSPTETCHHMKKNDNTNALGHVAKFVLRKSTSNPDLAHGSSSLFYSSSEAITSLKTPSEDVENSHKSSADSSKQKDLNMKGITFGDLIFEDISNSTLNKDCSHQNDESIIVKDTKNIQICQLLRSSTDPIIKPRSSRPMKENCLLPSKETHKVKELCKNSNQPKLLVSKVLEKKNLKKIPSTSTSKCVPAKPNKTHTLPVSTQPTRTAATAAAKNVVLPCKTVLKKASMVTSKINSNLIDQNKSFSSSKLTSSSISIASNLNVQIQNSNKAAQITNSNTQQNRTPTVSHSAKDASTILTQNSKICGNAGQLKPSPISLVSSSPGRNVAAPIFVPRTCSLLKTESSTAYIAKSESRLKSNEEVLPPKNSKHRISAENDAQVRELSEETPDSVKSFFIKAAAQKQMKSNSNNQSENPEPHIVQPDLQNTNLNNEVEPITQSQSNVYSQQSAVLDIGGAELTSVDRRDLDITKADSCAQTEIVNVSTENSKTQVEGVASTAVDCNLSTPTPVSKKSTKVDKGSMTDLEYDIATQFYDKPLNMQTERSLVSSERSITSMERSVESLKSMESINQLSMSDDSMMSTSDQQSIKSWPPLRSNTSIVFTSTKSTMIPNVALKRNSIPLPKQSQRNEYSSKKPISLNNKKPSSPQKNVSLQSKLLIRTPKEPKRTVTKDADGWETVTSRSRFKDKNSQQLSLSSSNLKSNSCLLNKFDIKKRYLMASPATSLPSLSSLISCDDNSKPQSGGSNKKTSEPNKKTTDFKEKDRPIISSAGGTYKKNKEKKSDLKKNENLGKDLKSKKNNVPPSDLSKSDSESDEVFRAKEKHLEEEAALLKKQISDLQSSEIDVDTEADEVEVEDPDVESIVNRKSLEETYSHVLDGMSWTDQMETLDKLEELMLMDRTFKNISWDERMKKLEQLEDIVCRHPGRAIEIHQKLSQPLRTQTIPEMVKRYYCRVTKATQKREKLLKEKSCKLRELLNKVEKIQIMQNQLQDEKRKQIDEKLKKAEENRNCYLSNIRKKAHDEEEKGREIAFINELEAQNKRHDFLAQCQEEQDRLQGIVKERAIKQERKAEKEAAVEERKKIIEAKRQEKLEKLKEKRRIKDERVGRELLEKEKVRLELAREKEIDRQERRQALNAAQLANVEELQKKIQTKLEESAKRHEQNIEQIKKKASITVKMSNDNVEPPECVPYALEKMCSLCNTIIRSEVHLQSHLRGRFHEENLKKVTSSDSGGSNTSVEKLDNDAVYIIDAPTHQTNEKVTAEKDRKKVLRKKSKKILSKLLANSFDFKEAVHKQNAEENEKENVHQNDKLGNTSLGSKKHSLNKVNFVNGDAAHEEIPGHGRSKKRKKTKACVENSGLNGSKIRESDDKQSEILSTTDGLKVKESNKKALVDKRHGDVGNNHCLETKTFRILQSANSCVKSVHLINELNDVLSLPHFKGVDSPNKARVLKCIREMESLIVSQGCSIWANCNVLSMEKNLTQLIRIFKQSNALFLEQNVFKVHHGFKVLFKFLNLAYSKTENELSEKIFLTCINCLIEACRGNIAHCLYVLCSEHVVLVLNLLKSHLVIMLENNNEMCNVLNDKQYHSEPMCNLLMILLELVLNTFMETCAGIANKLRCNKFKSDTLNSNENEDESSQSKENKQCVKSSKKTQVISENGGEKPSKEGQPTAITNSITSKCLSDEFIVTNLYERLQDVLNYNICTGIVDSISEFCNRLCTCIDSNQNLAQFLETCINFLNSLVNVRIFISHNLGNEVNLMEKTISSTELFGTISMLYGTLLHQDAPPRDTNFPPSFSLPKPTLHVIHSTLKLLNSVANLQLSLFQAILGAEGISLQLRHIATYLLWYCSSDNEEVTKELLHLVIQLVGFFAVKNTDNQLILQSGFTPTVLRQLCNLPFSYFSQPDLTAILFPTLLACCSGNDESRKILDEELSYELLEEFSKSPVALTIPLMNIVNSTL